MSSNTPPNDNKTSPNNIFSPPCIRHTSTNVRVVSQSQSRTLSQSDTPHSEDYQLNRLAEVAIHHDFESQTPMRGALSVAPISTLIIQTPTKKQRLNTASSKLFTSDPIAQATAKKKREQLMASTEKRNRNFGNPQDVILWWHRSDRLTAQRAITSTKPLNLNNTYRIISSCWYNEKTEKRFDFKPFKSLKSSLQATKSMPLSTRHRRMLLEDIILLLPGTMVVCLISPKHPFFRGPGSVTFRNKLELAMHDDPLKVTTFSSKCFFGINLLVKSNPKGDEIAAGIPSREEIKQYCLDRVYGAGVNFEFVTGEYHQFKFIDFFEHDKFIHLWHIPKATRVAHLCRVIQNVSSAQTLAPTTLNLKM